MTNWNRDVQVTILQKSRYLTQMVAKRKHDLHFASSTKLFVQMSTYSFIIRRIVPPFDLPQRNTLGVENHLDLTLKSVKNIVWSKKHTGSVQNFHLFRLKNIPVQLQFSLMLPRKPHKTVKFWVLVFESAWHAVKFSYPKAFSFGCYIEELISQKGSHCMVGIYSQQTGSCSFCSFSQRHNTNLGLW